MQNRVKRTPFGGKSVEIGCLDFVSVATDVGERHVIIHDKQDIGSADCDFLAHRHAKEGGMEDREETRGDETRDDGYPVHREARRLAGR